jgi:hypothetical protein
MTPPELRRLVLDCPEPVVRRAVATGLRECPVKEAANDPDFTPLVSFWLTDPDSLEALPPPLPAETVAANRAMSDRVHPLDARQSGLIRSRRLTLLSARTKVILKMNLAAHPSGFWRRSSPGHSDNDLQAGR